MCCFRGFSSGASNTTNVWMRPHKFHGRYETDGRECESPGCREAGEFRAPGPRAPGFDGPGDWRWFCLEHVRAFRADSAGVPRWADFDDPLDAIGARAADIRRRAAGRQDFVRFTSQERDALGVMGLGPQTDRQELRKRYSALVRRYHPDRNGGDRSHEALLQRVVEAYQLLRKAAAFG